MRYDAAFIMQCRASNEEFVVFREREKKCPPSAGSGDTDVKESFIEAVPLVAEGDHPLIIFQVIPLGIFEPGLRTRDHVNDGFQDVKVLLLFIRDF